MLSLTIDGYPAVVKSGTSIKLTRNNPYFEISGDYTLEVSLPIAGCVQNRRIFGTIDRSTTDFTNLIGKKYTMELVAHPIALQGTAEIVSVTEREVKVQLLAGISDFAHAIDDDGCVDDLDLGHAWDIFPEFEDGLGSWQPGYSREEMAKMFSIKPVPLNQDFTVDQMMHGAFGETDSLCYPIYSKTDDVLLNPTVWNDDNGALILYYWDSETASYKPTNEDGFENLSSMPYLCDIIERIINAVGYEVGDITSLTGTWRKNLFIANTRSVIERAKTLPHWTMATFIEELQKTFGGVFVVSGKAVSFIMRKQWYGASSEHIKLERVDDVHSVEIDPDGEQSASSGGNVAYAWPATDDILDIPQEVWENADIRHLSSYDLIEAEVEAMSETERARSMYLYHDTSTGYHYALLHRKDSENVYDLVRVNQCGALYRIEGSYERDVELDIVPVRMDLLAYVQSIAPTTFFRGTLATGLPIMSGDDTSLGVRTYYSIDEAINPNQSEGGDTYTDTTKDKLELAYYDAHTTSVSPQTGKTAHIPTGIQWLTDPDSGLLAFPTNISPPAEEDASLHWWKLSAPEGTECIGNALTGAAQIDEREEVHFDIYDRFSLDPMAPYNIKNKRYACRKLEITITEDGIKYPIEGTFHEITD